MTVFREQAPQASSFDAYLDKKRQEYIAGAGTEIGDADAVRLREDLVGLTTRVEDELGRKGRRKVCYLVLGRVQSGKTGHQLGMLSWAADRCDVAIMFTGVTEALNGQSSQRIGDDLGALPTSPILQIPVPTRAQAEHDRDFLDSVVKRTRERRDYREGAGLWPERLPVLVTMKTKQRVDALRWAFEQVSEQLGEGVTALIIDDEADQASPNALASRDEEAATYEQLAGLREAAAHHVWLSYTATPQAIYLTDRDGALRPDYCAVSRPGTDYFGVASLMKPTRRTSRVEVHDWQPHNPARTEPPFSLRRAIADLLVARWLRTQAPDAFYRRAGGPGKHGMSSVQMLVHTSHLQKDHETDTEMVKAALATLRDGLGQAIRAEDPTQCPVEISQAWEALAERVQAASGGTENMPDLGIEQLFAIGSAISAVAIRTVNSDARRAMAHAVPLPTDRAGWEAQPAWIVVGGGILGRGLTIPQLVTTYFTRYPAVANEDTVAQQMRFCGYRDTYAHVVTVHARPETFDGFEHLALVERVLLSTAEDWAEADKDLRLEEPTLWYVKRSNRAMRPTRAGVRDRDLVDLELRRQLLSLKQVFRPNVFQHNSKEVIEWLDATDAASELDGWLLVECGAEDVRELLGKLALLGRDAFSWTLADAVMSPHLGDLGIAHLPHAVLLRNDEALRAAAAGNPPDFMDLPVRHLDTGSYQADRAEWLAGWGPVSAIQPERWFDVARLDVPHVGDGQRRPIAALGYEAVTTIIEPLAGHHGDLERPEAIGLAVTVLTPEGFEVQAIGVPREEQQA